MNTRLDPAAEQAIDWMMDLRATPGDAARRHGFEQWLAADPAHLSAWTRLQERAGAPFERLRRLDQHAPGHAQQAREVLLEPMVSRRSVIRGVAALGLFGSASWLAARSPQGQSWLADFSTGVGQRRTIALPDGSQLRLNACSAVDLRFSARERCVVLRRGEVIVEARAEARPMQVRSAQAVVSSVGAGRWMVSQQEHATVAVNLGPDVQVKRVNDGEQHVLGRNEAVRVSASSMVSLGRQPHRADWSEGVFSAVDEPLETLVEALRAYRAGFIRVSRDARDLRVQGVFSLDRPDQALEAMAQSLPLRIERYSPWLVLISRGV
ncbi:FecR family protein [Pseudomonas sp. TE3610]